MPLKQDVLDVMLTQLGDMQNRLTNHDQSIASLQSRQVGVETALALLKSVSEERKETIRWWVAAVLSLATWALGLLIGLAWPR